MACHQCGMVTFENFTNDGSTASAPQVSSSCSSKAMMGNCLYTAQGMFVCNTPPQDTDRGVAQNPDMAFTAFTESRPFSHAAPLS